MCAVLTSHCTSLIEALNMSFTVLCSHTCAIDAISDRATGNSSAGRRNFLDMQPAIADDHLMHHSQLCLYLAGERQRGIVWAGNQCKQSAEGIERLRDIVAAKCLMQFRALCASEHGRVIIVEALLLDAKGRLDISGSETTSLRRQEVQQSCWQFDWQPPGQDCPALFKLHCKTILCKFSALLEIACGTKGWWQGKLQHGMQLAQLLSFAMPGLVHLLT